MNPANPIHPRLFTPADAGRPPREAARAMAEHHHWPASIAGASATALFAMASEIPWGYLIAVAGMALASWGPPAVRTWRDWRLARLEIEARRRELEGR